MKELINYLANKLNIQNRELLEKDVLLHLILTNLEKDKTFYTNFIFKGGTCLTKCYLGYYRFSEDLDFSYSFPEKFKNKSENQIRRELSKIIDNLSLLLQVISEKLNLEFSKDKSDNKFYEFGSNNKFTTFKLWYNSEINQKSQFIKIQINFIELFFYKFKLQKTTNLVENINSEEFRFLFPDYQDVLYYPDIRTYDIKEILLEKYRAILTRKALKARDFIDLYLILNTKKLVYLKFKDQILEKTMFMLKYQKYNENLKLRGALGFRYSLGEESKLLIKEINLINLSAFNTEQISFLEELVEKLKKFSLEDNRF